MNEFKHSKHKNVGIIFELLTRQIVNDILCDKKTNALHIVRRNFKKGSEISKELNLYRSLVEFNKKDKTVTSKFLDLVIAEYKKLDIAKLKKEKYKLLGEIKNSFNQTTFFNSRITNYKLLASIYKLFEYSLVASPTQLIDSYSIVVENLTAPNTEVQESKEALVLWDKQSPEIQKLAFHLIVEKFNTKYKTLNSKQKILIGKYINENSDSNEFKDFIISECATIKSTLAKIVKTVPNITLKIKLNEVVNLLNEIITSKFIKEEHLSAMLTYYELIETLKK